VYGDGFFSGNPFIKSEFADYSIEEYLSNDQIENKLSLKEIFM